MSKRKKIVIGNWKNNPATPEEAKKIFKGVVKRAVAVSGVETVICPPTLYTGLFSKEKFGAKVRLGAQNVFHKNEGACTGEITARMLESAHVSHVIIGHSERRALGETDAVIAQKAAVLLREGFKPIICIGEPTHDPEGEYLRFLENQITSSMALIQNNDMLDVVIAYEPIWTIGATEAMTGNDIYQTTLYIRKILRDVYNQTISEAMTIVYGGSVNPSNIADIMSKGNVDGVLVGRDSLNPDNFGDIINVVSKS